MNLDYQTIKALVLNHPDKASLIQVLTACDNSSSPAITRSTLNKQIQMSPFPLERILYFLAGINILDSQSVGRTQAYAVTPLYGGRLLDDLKEGGSDA